MPTRTKPRKQAERAGNGRPWLSTALTGLMLGAALGACIWGAHWTNARAARHLAARPVSATIEWPALPGADGQTWLPEDVQNELLAIVYDRIERSPPAPLDRGLLADLAEELRATGWFSRIESVDRTAGAVIRIRGEWRIPTAWVRHQDRDYLIAAGGELLPIAWSPGETTLPRIIAPKAPPPRTAAGRTALGEPWPGDDIRAGLLVLNLLGRYPFASQVRGIDVAGYADRRRLELITDRNTRVVWGAAPGDFKPGEVSTQTKLERLALLHAGREYGQRIDAGEEKLEICGPYMEVVRVAGRENP